MSGAVHEVVGMRPGTMRRLIDRAEPGVTRFTAGPIEDHQLPLVVIRGVQDGPRVCVSAGVHGSEYCAIEAAQRLLAISSEIRGTLVVLPVVNTPAFRQRSVYTSPLDGKNLNRVFPGDPAGTQTERLAYWLVDEVLTHVDAYIDLHCGDLNEALEPFTLFREGNDKAEHLARVFGFSDVIASPATGMTISAAADAGVHAIIAEAGGGGRFEPQAIDSLVDGVHRVLLELEVIPHKVPPSPHYNAISVSRCVSVVAEICGLWSPTCSAGSFVEAHSELGSIRNFFGDKIASVTAPVTGKVMFNISSLAVNRGETVAGICFC
ncbi:succinylglutamate desuccinylase/aspartoacylase family protein [Rhizobium mongolense]|uniref:Succinylglutamate desuccinylase/Aspartoacylase catalytic domain-containing protein n=2 Tax=Rhizobium mongolense TaxID=57676 RepID=A0ABR6IZK2_9HYPH|nr:succinylglutamate desuccinylase/aspartoacylase family protein [Rhizobium mongolense]MBB4233348.1 hypothetical protein [Rhizobium mongolense]TVZ75315.1 hypothetical protein BCL32_0808 [Rhizobium mongolense USDA 1844]